MTPEQADIVAEYRAGLIDRGTAYGLLAFHGHRDPRTALIRPATPPGTAPQGWDAVHRRSA